MMDFIHFTKKIARFLTLDNLKILVIIDVFLFFCQLLVILLFGSILSFILVITHAIVIKFCLKTWIIICMLYCFKFLVIVDIETIIIFWLYSYSRRLYNFESSSSVRQNFLLKMRFTLSFQSC